MSITYNERKVKRINEIEVLETAYCDTGAYIPETGMFLKNQAIAHSTPTRFRDAGEPYLRIKRTSADDWDIKRFDPPYPTQAQVLKQAEGLHYKVARVKLAEKELLIRLRQAKDLIEEHFEDGGRGPRKQGGKPCELKLNPQCTGKATHQLDWEADDFEYAMETGGHCYCTTVNVCIPCREAMLKELEEHLSLWRARWTTLPATTPRSASCYFGSDDSPPWNIDMPLSPSWIEYWKDLKPREFFYHPGEGHHGLAFRVDTPVFFAAPGFEQLDMPIFKVRFKADNTIAWAAPRHIFKEHEPACAPAIELPDIPAGEDLAGIAAENALKSIVADWHATELGGFDTACIETLAEDVDDVIERLTKWKMDALALSPARKSIQGVADCTAHNILNRLAPDTELRRNVYRAAEILEKMGCEMEARYQGVNENGQTVWFIPGLAGRLRINHQE